tara:strand:+ start:14160 stop:15629 length:1470 start_codon:yes stop_codon:yes gene_type:complete
MTTLRKLLLPALALGLFTFTAPTFASVLFQDDDAKDEAQDEESEDGEAAADEDEGDKTFVIRGADIHTGTGAVLRGATLIAINGKIDEIGYDLALPEDAEILDATGFRLYPGLVAVSSIGLFGGGSPIEDTVDPFSRTMTLAVAGGITSTVQGSEVAKLKRGHIKDLVIGSRPLQSMSYSKSSPAGKRSLREKFDGAAAYIREYKQWELDVRSNKDLKEPKKSGVDSGALSVLLGQARALFNADDRTDLLEIAKLAQRYEFRPVIDGCREGWTVAADLGRAGATAIITPRERRSQDESIMAEGGSSIENAAILYASGVDIAIIPGTKGVSLDGIAGRDIMHLPIEAAFAIRGGLPEDAALAAITTVPARLLGVSHRVGRIEVGMDADFIVTDGDVLHYATFVQWAVIDGEIIYDKEDEMYFAHIRPRPVTELAPVDPVDAGEADEDVVEPPADEESDDEDADEEPGDEPEGSGDGEDGEDGDDGGTASR